MRMVGFACILVGLLAGQMILRFNSSLNHDPSWYLYVAQGLLHGKKLYVDFVEVNPPLGLWLAVPPAWLAETTGLSPAAGFYVFLFALTLASLTLVWRYSADQKPNQRKVFFLATAAVLLFVPGENFGQREHFMVLMFLPWLLLRQQSGQSIRGFERALVGVVAGLGIALKPYAIIAPLFVEAILLIQRRQWRSALAVENLAAMFAVMLYGIAIAVFTPEFFDGIITLGRDAYLPYYGYPLANIFQNALWAVVFIALALFGLSNSRVQVLWAAALGFLVSYFLQDKGFTYHIVPAVCFAVLACVATLQAHAGTPHFKAIFAGVTALAAVAMLIVIPQTYVQNRDISARIEAFRGPGVQSVFIVSNRFSHAFPYIVEQHLRWASRLPTQWLVPYVSNHWRPGEAAHDAIVAKDLDWTMEDLQNLKPDLVAIDNTKAQRDAVGGFEILNFWRDDPRFAALWQNYQLVSGEGDILIYLRQK